MGILIGKWGFLDNFGLKMGDFGLKMGDFGLKMGDFGRF
jgi:hypothetical protein